jgi:hypothetical protein
MSVYRPEEGQKWSDISESLQAQANSNVSVKLSGSINHHSSDRDSGVARMAPKVLSIGDSVDGYNSCTTSDSSPLSSRDLLLPKLSYRIITQQS